MRESVSAKGMQVCVLLWRVRFKIVVVSYFLRGVPVYVASYVDVRERKENVRKRKEKLMST